MYGLDFAMEGPNPKEGKGRRNDIERCRTFIISKRCLEKATFKDTAGAQCWVCEVNYRREYMSAVPPVP